MLITGLDTHNRGVILITRAITLVTGVVTLITLSYSLRMMDRFLDRVLLE